MDSKPIIRRKSKRKGGSLEGSRFYKNDKKGTYSHNRHVSKMMRKGDVGSLQNIPHEVFIKHANKYIPSDTSTLDEKFIPWGSLPQDVAEELHSNIPNIKNILKDSVIKPSKFEMNDLELQIIREKNYVFRSHNNGILDTHHKIPKLLEPSMVFVDVIKGKLNDETSAGSLFSKTTTAHQESIEESTNLLSDIQLSVLSSEVSSYSIFTG